MPAAVGVAAVRAPRLRRLAARLLAAAAFSRSICFAKRWRAISSMPKVRIILRRMS